MDGLTKVLDSRVPFGFDLFSKSFENAVPLPPPGSYYMILEDGVTYMVTEDGVTRMITE